MKRVLRDLTVSLIVGLLFFGFAALATREPGGSVGFPMSYSHPVVSWQFVNSFTGCGYSYDLTSVVLNYLFWVAVSFVITYSSSAARQRSTKITVGLGVLLQNR